MVCTVYISDFSSSLNFSFGSLRGVLYPSVVMYTRTEIEITGGHWSLSEHLGQMATQVWICSDNIYYMMYIGGLANIPLTGQLSGQISILISTSARIF